jgi:hypothetical protein
MRRQIYQFGRLAQWIARLTSDQKVPGSSPGSLELTFLCFLFFRSIFWLLLHVFHGIARLQVQATLLHTHTTLHHIMH